MDHYIGCNETDDITCALCKKEFCSCNIVKCSLGSLCDECATTAQICSKCRAIVIKPTCAKCGLNYCACENHKC